MTLLSIVNSLGVSVQNWKREELTYSESHQIRIYIFEKLAINAQFA